MPRYRWECPECGECEDLLSISDRKSLREHGDLCAYCNLPSIWTVIYNFSGAGIMFGNARTSDVGPAIYSEAERRAYLEENPNVRELSGEQARRTRDAMAARRDEDAYNKGFRDSGQAKAHKQYVGSAMAQGAQKIAPPDPRDMEDQLIRTGAAVRDASGGIWRVPSGVTLQSVERGGGETYTRQAAREDLSHKIEAVAAKHGVA